MARCPPAAAPPPGRLARGPAAYRTCTSGRAGGRAGRRAGRGGRVVGRAEEREGGRAVGGRAGERAGKQMAGKSCSRSGARAHLEQLVARPPLHEPERGTARSPRGPTRRRLGRLGRSLGRRTHVSPHRRRVCGLSVRFPLLALARGAVADKAEAVGAELGVGLEEAARPLLLGTVLARVRKLSSSSAGR